MDDRHREEDCPRDQETSSLVGRACVKVLKSHRRRYQHHDDKGEILHVNAPVNSADYASGSIGQKPSKALNKGFNNPFEVLFQFQTCILDVMFFNEKFEFAPLTGNLMRPFLPFGHAAVQGPAGQAGDAGAPSRSSDPRRSPNPCVNSV